MHGDWELMDTTATPSLRGRVVKLLKTWFGFHVAVIPPFALLIFMAHKVVEWWPDSVWLQGFAIYVTLHVMIGWIWLAASILYRLINKKE